MNFTLDVSSKIKLYYQLYNQIAEGIKSGKIPAAAKNSTPEQIDSLITNYQTQIRQAVQAANSVPNGVAGAKPEPGALFSINA